MKFSTYELKHMSESLNKSIAMVDRARIGCNDIETCNGLSSDLKKLKKKIEKGSGE